MVDPCDLIDPRNRTVYDKAREQWVCFGVVEGELAVLGTYCAAPGRYQDNLELREAVKEWGTLYLHGLHPVQLACDAVTHALVGYRPARRLARSTV